LTVAYAIIKVRGKQFRVTEGEIVRVPSFTADAGSSVEFQVLARGGGDGVEIGAPFIDGESVTGTVVEHGRERKIIVFRKKRKKQYKRTHGHRQNFTAVRIDSIGPATTAEASDTAEDQGSSDE
jgi:large subunit ribosomal protein L21